MKHILDLTTQALQMGCAKTNLRYLTGVFLGKAMSKRHQMTNWELHNLTRPQLEYAALDALASLEIHVEMNHRFHKFNQWLDQHPDAKTEISNSMILKPLKTSHAYLQSLCDKQPPELSLSIEVIPESRQGEAGPCSAVVTANVLFNIPDNSHTTPVISIVKEKAQGKNREWAVATATYNVCLKLVKKRVIKKMPHQPSTFSESELDPSMPPPVGLTHELWASLIEASKPTQE